MKRIAGYVAAFAAGTMFSGAVAYAGTTVVKAVIGAPAAISVNGNKVATSPTLTYGKTTYVALNSVEQALQSAGMSPSWSHNTLSLSSPQYLLSTASGATQKVSVSQLPFTFQASDGTVITLQSVDATSSGTVLNVTVANDGSKLGQDGLSVFQFSSLAAGGQGIKLVDDADYDGNTDPSTSALYGNINPGESVQDTLTYQALPSGVSGFTWYFSDFDGNNYGVYISLR
ncbi:hypothetical protein [Alicyclobacillus vulcanalis]|uniref:Copper amine oxidase N-terminal domain-containing protein n=1 Tax=Alicyclobacillus vulcanalis TaxID=252246 RepID=A0A1N7MQG0_9BACL|nr:hypothetical protein [Alicyclobacillus vulcanalis]SIS88290.1 hypothetical protein SAMN05421799_10627 [Alicyclobacillus vulcanalis]